MDVTNGGPGQPLDWLPSGLTALILSPERADSLPVQLKAFGLTQAMKSLLSLKKPQKDFRNGPGSSFEFNRSTTLDALPDLAKPLGGAGACRYGGVSMRLAGIHSASNSCQCEGEGCCKFIRNHDFCGYVCSECVVCDSFVSEEDLDQRYYEAFYCPEVRYQWGFPLAASVMLNGPNGSISKCAPDAYFEVIEDSGSPKIPTKIWSHVQKFGGANPLESRAAFKSKEFADSFSGSTGGVVEENVTEEDARGFKGTTGIGPSMWSIDSVPGSRDAGKAPINFNTEIKKRCKDRQCLETSILHDTAEILPQMIDRVTQVSNLTIKSLKNCVAFSFVSEAVAAVKSSQNSVTALKHHDWWPFAVQPAVAAVENGLVPTATNAMMANHGATKRNPRMGQNAGAGALAGGVVSLCLHPVDTLKTLVQARAGGNRNLLPIMSAVISERGLRGLYRGLGSNLTVSAPISAIYTLTYETVKAGLLRHIPEDMSALAHCVAGGCASVATSFVYTPSDCVKQRMQVHGLYENSWEAFTSILKEEGLPTLYKGWGAVLCRNVPQSVVKFYTYEGLKRCIQRGQPRDTPLSTPQALVIGGAAGSTAALFSTPFDVVKTRLQTQIPGTAQQYTGVIHVFQSIVTTEGVAGLYRGLVPRILIYITQGALFFASYEFIKRVLAVKVPRLLVKTPRMEEYKRQTAPVPTKYS
ncbi:uncharacterized protein [Physcomitrium patens]|uniref:Uncharacterized protein n=1 Tax=Physcomitrium patens TaxID=3218 RepID=A0A2K1IQS9_PHYPA|nr:uncharacterized protein LOC112273854 isoform X2 [Physcomitrium patens]PNR31641.1 hypothetical protein PHYPA_025762 [Physcomitrium patens]|eukprot:XP_024358621.1 uncharacterized protein LOC112273854 isoform X2 [Physcomitrella patens]